MVTITPLAAKKLRELMIEDDKDPEKDYLRVFVQGGGCSGFQYGLMLEENKTEADQIFESNGVRIVIDPISINYLENAEVDFVKNETGGGFSIKNPNAKSTCGCGQSFNTEQIMITLTPKAAEYTKKLLEKEKITPPPGGIRFLVKAGGCSGLECIHKLERTDNHHDILILSHGVRVLVDPKSMTILEGTEVDHSDNLLEKPFIFNNPNAKTSCGCGTSFELKDKKNTK